MSTCVFEAVRFQETCAGIYVENIMQSDAGDMKKGINVKEVEQNVNKKAYGVHCCGTSLA